MAGSKDGQNNFLVFLVKVHLLKVDTDIMQKKSIEKLFFYLTVPL
jgi:hypothetical protein